MVGVDEEQVQLSPRDLLDTQSERRRWLALYVLCVGMLMIVLDATIVNVALPTIQEELGFSQTDLAWVVNAYLIPFGGLLLLSGRIGDLIGQRRIFSSVPGTAGAGEGEHGHDHPQDHRRRQRTADTLDKARCDQQQRGPRENAEALAPGERAQIGLYTFVAVAGGSIGLLLGGVLTETINWHWIFFVNILVGLATALFAIRLVADREGIGLTAGADLPGAVLLTGANPCEEAGIRVTIGCGGGAGTPP
jgi:MFS family permease